MNSPDLEIAMAKLQAWRSAHAELVSLEAALGEAMTEYARTLGEPPRQLIIQAERKREYVARLFEMAMEALDMHSTAKTGHTNFGGLS
ncbi:MAG: hypothetical protein EOO25_02420 [Comamonadaceae bacterium]|nr:MAG: hypothetical protein EOO25_02420 [Comamonadaceae bacterium]